MALYNCPECNGSVSEEATVCPHCGKPNPVDESVIEARRLEIERREAQMQKRLAVEQMAGRKAKRPTAQGFTLAGINLRYACPIVAIVATVVVCASRATGRILKLPHFGFDHDGPLIGRFLYWMAVATIPYFLATSLPLLTNLRQKAKLSCIIGLLGALFCFVLWSLNTLMFNVISRLDQNDINSWYEHWWYQNDFGLWCGHAAALAQVASIVCLSMTCLSFGKKVLGFVSLPFAIIFVLTFPLLIIQIHMDDPLGSRGWLWIPVTVSFAIVVILGSVATMLDEKNRQKGMS
jgi:hypothetical protein